MFILASASYDGAVDEAYGPFLTREEAEAFNKYRYGGYGSFNVVELTHPYEGVVGNVIDYLKREGRE